jgi:hypothetical protein
MNGPRGSIIEFVVYVWMDSEDKYSGTRRWLRLQGLASPSEEQLAYFSQKIRKTILWRASVVLLLVIAWFLFLRLTGLRPAGLNIVPPISGLVYGFTNPFGTKLPGAVRTKDVVRLPPFKHLH